MIAKILGVLFSLYVLIRFVIFVFEYTKKCKKLSLWPQNSTFSLILVLIKEFKNLNCIDYISKVFNEYENRDKITVIWLTCVPVILTYNRNYAKKILSGNNSVTLNKSKMIYDGITDTFANSIFSINSDDWKIRRKLCSVPLNATNVTNITRQLNIESRKFVDNFEKISVISDVFHETKKTTFSLLFNILFDYDLGDEVEFAINATEDATKTVIKKGFSIFSISPTLYRFTSKASWETKLIKRLGELKNKILSVKMDSSLKNLKSKIEKSEKAKNDGTDAGNWTLIDIFLKHYNGSKNVTKNESSWNGWSIEEVDSQMTTFIIAGVDTLSIALAYMLYNLGKYPECQEKIYQEIISTFGKDRSQDLSVESVKKLRFLEAFVYESLRVQPIVSIVGRHITQDLELDEKFTIPAGTDVVLCLEHMFLDPDYFPEPLEFKPERFLDSNQDLAYTFIPFSAGPRNCIAKRISIQILTHYAVRMVSSFEIKFTKNSPENITPKMKRFMLVSKPVVPIELEFKPRLRNENNNTLFSLN